MLFFARNIRTATARATTYNTTPISQTLITRGFKTSSVRMGVHNLNNKKEFDSALTENKVVVLDAFATWCGPCKVIAPTVAKFSEQFSSAHFVKIDVDEVPDVAQELGIRAMPTFVLFKDGEKINEVVGANPKALLAAIEEATKEPEPAAAATTEAAPTAASE